MKIREIREMNTEELKKRIDEEERNIVDLRFSHQLKQLTNTAKLGLAKKDIARLKTVLREREMAETSSKKNEGVKA
jgi:large subunit ribosomal protein L29